MDVAVEASGGPLSLCAQRKYAKKSAPARGLQFGMVEECWLGCFSVSGAYTRAVEVLSEVL